MRMGSKRPDHPHSGQTRSAAALLGHLEQRLDDMLADLRELVEQESPSADKARVDRLAEFVAAYAERMTGARAEIVPQRESGDHVRLRLAGDGPPVLVVGHFDTVWPAGTLAGMPFRVEGGLARGPGVFDMKGGLVQGLWAVRALRETGGRVPAVTFVLNADEEVGSLTSRELIEAEAARAAACLILEPAYRGALKTARKGVGMYEVEVTGKASHAGSEPFEGVSAIDEICRLTLDLHAQTSRESGTTVNVGVIEGGTAVNVVAARAKIGVDLRVATRADGERMNRLILDLRPHDQRAAVRVTGGINRPPLERTPRVVELYGHAARLAAELGLELGEASVGGGSDGNFCAAVNPSVIDGLGAVGDGAHALHEHLVVAEMPRRAALLARLLETLGSPGQVIS